MTSSSEKFYILYFFNIKNKNLTLKVLKNFCFIQVKVTQIFAIVNNCPKLYKPFLSGVLFNLIEKKYCKYEKLKSFELLKIGKHLTIFLFLFS